MVTSAPQPTGSVQAGTNAEEQEVVELDYDGLNSRLAACVRESRVNGERKPLFEAACLTVEAAFLQVIQLKEAQQYKTLVSFVSSELDKMKRDERFTQKQLDTASKRIAEQTRPRHIAA